VLLFVWQQVALAAGLCPFPGRIHAVDAVQAPSSPACVHAMRGHTDLTLCAQDCAQGSLVQTDARLPQVPASLLPPLAPAMPKVVRPACTGSAFSAAFLSQAGPPPIRLVFCSLLI